MASHYLSQCSLVDVEEKWGSFWPLQVRAFEEKDQLPIITIRVLLERNEWNHYVLVPLFLQCHVGVLVVPCGMYQRLQGSLEV